MPSPSVYYHFPLLPNGIWQGKKAAQENVEHFNVIIVCQRDIDICIYAHPYTVRVCVCVSLCATVRCCFAYKIRRNVRSPKMSINFLNVLRTCIYICSAPSLSLVRSLFRLFVCVCVSGHACIKKQLVLKEQSRCLPVYQPGMRHRVPPFPLLPLSSAATPTGVKGHTQSLTHTHKHAQYPLMYTKRQAREKRSQSRKCKIIFFN